VRHTNAVGLSDLFVSLGVEDSPSETRDSHVSRPSAFVFAQVVHAVTDNPCAYAKIEPPRFVGKALSGVPVQGISCSDLVADLTTYAQTPMNCLAVHEIRWNTGSTMTQKRSTQSSMTG